MNFYTKTSSSDDLTLPPLEINNFYWLLILSIRPPRLPVFLLNTFFHRPQSLTISSLNHSAPDRTTHPLGLLKSLHAHPIARDTVCLPWILLILPSKPLHHPPRHPPTCLPTTILRWCISHVEVCVLEFDVPPSLKWLFFQVYGAMMYSHYLGHSAIWISYFLAEHAINLQSYLSPE